MNKKKKQKKKKKVFSNEINLKAKASIENMTLFSNPMTVAFRNKEYAAYSIETLLGLKLSENMKDEMIIHTEDLITRLGQRDARLDVLIKFPKKKIHVEIQNIRNKDEVERAMFYMGSILFDVGKGQKKIKPYNFVSIWICAFNPLGEDVPDLPYYTFEQMYTKKEDMHGIEGTFKLRDGVTLIFINAGFKWEKILNERELTNSEIALMEYLEDMKQSDVDKIMHKEASNVLSLYKEGGSMYDKLHEEYMYFHDKEMRLDRKKAEQKGEQRGIKIGEERGIKIGEQQGIKIGEERGIKIGEQQGVDSEKIATAKRLLAKKQDLSFIAEMTMLDIKTIESLQ